MIAQSADPTVSESAFVERSVEADGFRIRYLEAGAGAPVVCLHGAGGLLHSPAHDLLAQRYRVLLLEAPGFGSSPANERSGSMAELAATMAAAVQALGIERFHLIGNSFGGRLALWLAAQFPEQIETLVLSGPAAILPEGRTPPRPSTPEERLALLYAHPERQAHQPPPDPAITAKQGALVGRLRGPGRDADLEARMAELSVPVLVLFGTEDRMIPPAMGRHYVEVLPNAYLIYIYDAGHELDGDRPEAFAALVSDFLDRRDGFLVNQQSGVLHP